MKTYVLLLGLFVVFASFTQVGGITVKVNSIKSKKGSLLIYLYKSAEGFPTDPKKAWKTAKVEVNENLLEHTFDGIPIGSYAISIVHDENANGVIDTNFIGIPKEGIGVSNNAKGRFGPPKFEEAKFSHSGILTLSEIKITY